MRLVLDHTEVRRESWNLSADGTFTKGVHLISGDVGSGKSTLALLMSGILLASSGTVKKEGIKSQMMSFQFPEYHITGTTVREECESWGLDPSPLLTTIGLSKKHTEDPLRLSRGELKRLHLACILSRNYDLLILDEPFSSLDVFEKQRICMILSGKTDGITILFTHEQSVFPRTDYIWEIQDGELHLCGSLPACLTRWQHAPPVIKALIERGKTPENISLKHLEAAACAI